MASGATGSGVDVVISEEAAPELLTVALGLPGHACDELERTEIPGWISMALQTPAHRQWRDLLDDRHLVHATVAGNAPHALIHVNCVIEIDELRQAVDAIPRNRLLTEVPRAQLAQQRALVPNLFVAVHAHRGGGNSRVRRVINCTMAVSTINPIVRDMMPVIELDHLLHLVVLPGVVGAFEVNVRGPHSDQRNREQGRGNHSKDGI
jgi:hypothetical protein